MAEEIIFVDGVKVKKKFDNLLGISIKLEYFNNFAKEHQNNGYLNIDICKSKDKDSWYARLNTWKPDKTKSTNTPNVELISEEEIPY